MLHCLSTKILNNYHILLGILIGLYISSFVTNSLEPLCPKHHLTQANETDNLEKSALPDAQPSPAAPKRAKKVIRPRYYSTELGIREKLFIGVFTSEEKVEKLAVSLNETIRPASNQIRFFITAQYKLKSRVNHSGLVGFTDTRPRYRPFQVLKYISDNFAQDFDFYYLSNDFTYTNPHKIADVAGGISVSQDVYLGSRVRDGSYCGLEAGILLSNSAVRAVRDHLDWCIINSVSDDYSENLGRCIHHSIGLNCQDVVQGQRLASFRVKHFELRANLRDLSAVDEFNAAVSVHPVLEGDDFYLLNAYFLKQRLEQTKAEIDTLSATLTATWPPGSKPGATPLTRFDLPRQSFFNVTHIFFPDDFTNIKAHTRAERADIDRILAEIRLQSPPNARLHFKRLINGYKTFDLSRGLDYTLDLGFRDLHTGKEVVKRFVVSKPLGKVEILGVPYVTENSRVTILLPIEEDQAGVGMEFVKSYLRDLIDRKEKNFLMLVLLYQANTTTKGATDPFYNLKNFAIKTSNKYRNEEMKIAWVSIRLPDTRGDFVRIGDFPVLRLAIVDLALKKIGLDSLVLVLDPFVEISNDFLNRVRMNTISAFQIFAPIPFRQYQPKIAASQTARIEVGKNSGHFDREEYKYISFFSKDYVNARRGYQKVVPIIRVDNDIGLVLNDDLRGKGNVFRMFIEQAGDLHAMRATESGLKVKYHEGMGEKRCNWFLGNKNQLGRLLLSREDKIMELLGNV